MLKTILMALALVFALALTVAAEETQAPAWLIEALLFHGKAGEVLHGFIAGIS